MIFGETCKLSPIDSIGDRGYFCDEPSPFIPLFTGGQGEDTARSKNMSLSAFIRDAPITKYGGQIAGL
ncbi:MAG: hypothetical protein A2022_01080 [Deltaproteobacteria bacterium GWF2_42_12]|nr:MAG: hypothetical protein A2067_01275 [Deltaproteobacteria bacterium GWB2_42_7]OGP43403.1 MAG: hypothetical protein A2090_04050 [Deltaproteobacteria bacterium GWD2_42_10]OGP46142.1 MAG: hypothetical protein A2022_01080 [Deltaproteobacteria bacterium GWF2_42_12]OGQ35365.1 MAG: hypothetical protein A3H47_07830 [Deltaproteobacteria bacterium RIFCSPLOWO2_02_FULL_42_39]OGQ76829.1 MAG: hypothetical protein A2235_01560 [Deltaproteobacteria bacterium RIFOXYA2_FULL_42_10]